MRWGTLGGAENDLFGARDQPRAPPTMHALVGKRKQEKKTKCRYDAAAQTPPRSEKPEKKPDVGTTRGDRQDAATTREKWRQVRKRKTKKPKAKIL